jgi:predicted alpha/beta hydrolase
MPNEEITIKCPDGLQLAGTLLKPEKTTSGALVIASAMGVPRRFYHPFAYFLSDNGLAVLTFDYRGVGDSNLTGIDGAKVRLEDWGRLDIDAALIEISGRFKGKPLFLLGHSCGGQLFGLAKSSEKLSAVVFISAQLPNSKFWPFPHNLAMLAIWHLIIPALSNGRKTFPARKLGISSVDVPTGATLQWARWARLPGYFFNDKSGADSRRYGKFTFPLLARIFADDIYAPEKSVKALLKKMPGAAIEIVKTDGRSSGSGRIGHFGFFRERMRDTLWQETAAWLLKQTE